MQSNTTLSTTMIGFAKCLAVLLLVYCGAGATCSRAYRNPFATIGPPAPDVLMPGASLEQIIAVVNQNSGRVQSYQTNNASITVPGMPSIPLLGGKIAVQQPGRIRLQASTAITGNEVDLGSNDQLFWFWVKRNEPPALYYARHDQFVGSSAQQALPIDPQWLIDAIGLSQFSPTDQHQPPVPRGDGTVEIQSIIQTRAGSMTKSTLVDAKKAWMLQQHIYDGAGSLVASSRAISHRYYPELGVSLPQEIELNLPAMKMALKIDVGSVIINQASSSPELWNMPVISGYPQIDLGSAPAGAIFAPGAQAPLPSALKPTNTVSQSIPTQSTPPALPEPVTLPISQFDPSYQQSEFQQPMAKQLPPGGIEVDPNLTR